MAVGKDENCSEYMDDILKPVTMSLGRSTGEVVESRGKTNRISRLAVISRPSR